MKPAELNHFPLAALVRNPSNVTGGCKCRIGMMISFLFLVSALHGRYEPLQLTSSVGVTVEVVAIYKASPDGLTFSPKPQSPLIGSNELAIITTDWSNIDTSSLQDHPQLRKAYRSALNGKTTELQIGPHFVDKRAIVLELSTTLPDIFVTFSDSSGGTKINLRNFLSRKDYKDTRRWRINAKAKQSLLRKWENVSTKIEPIAYRSDIMRIQFDLEAATRAVEKILPESSVFDRSAADAMRRLIQTAPTRP